MDETKRFASVLECLTGTELEILRLLMDGAENKELAYRLDIPPDTIKSHVAAIMRKTGARNRTHAAVMMVRHAIECERVAAAYRAEFSGPLVSPSPAGRGSTMNYRRPAFAMLQAGKEGGQ